MTIAVANERAAKDFQIVARAEILRSRGDRHSKNYEELKMRNWGPWLQGSVSGRPNLKSQGSQIPSAQEL
jgi:hypothetical protein